MSRFATFVVFSIAFLCVPLSASAGFYLDCNGQADMAYGFVGEEREEAGEAGDAEDSGSVDVEETAPEAAPADDPVSALLQSEVLRYYRGIGAEPSEAELKSGLDAAFNLILAEISIGRIGSAIDEAISRHEPGGRVLFQVAVPRFVGAAAAQESAAAPEPEVLVEEDEVSIDVPVDRSGRWTRTRAITSIVFGGVSLFFGVPPLVVGTVTLVVIGVDGGFVGDLLAEIFGGFFVFGAIVGGALTVVGAILLHLGVENLRAYRAEQRRRENPDLRFTSARRAQVEWGIRFGVL